MIRRWIERWIGHDRLLVAYEKVKEDNEKLRVRHEELKQKHRILTQTHKGTTARAERRRVETAKLLRLYTRTLVELEWERYLAAENASRRAECVKIRLMDHDQAWDVADLLAERFGHPMYAYKCPRCPRNPITRKSWWHVTKEKNNRCE